MTESCSKYPIFTYSADAIVIIDHSQTILAFNPGAERIFGWAAEEIVGQPLATLIPARFHDSHAGHFKHFLAGAPTPRMMGQRGEIYGLRKNGAEFPAEASIFPMDYDGQAAFASILRDVSAQKATENRMEIQRQRLNAVFESTYQMVGLLSPSGTILEANRAALDFVGLSIDEVRGCHFAKAPWFKTLPNVRKTLNDAVNRACRGETSRGEIQIPDRQNRKRSFDFSIRPILDEHGNTKFLIPEARDITEFSRARAALAQSERNLLNAQRIARLGNWVWDIKSGDLAWSDEVYRIFGFDRDTPPSYERFLDSLHPDDRLKVEEAVALTLSKGEEYEIDHRIILPDGSVRIVHEVAEVTRDAEGQAIRLEGVVQDVTEARRNEDALVRARKRAEAASAAKSEFLSTISHELRTPLNAIIGFSEIMTNEMFGAIGNDSYREYIRNIHISGEHLLGIIDSILDVSRIERNAVILDEATISLLDLVDGSLSLYGAEAGMARNPVSVTLPQDDIALHADLRLCRQMLVNLLANSQKFCPAGTPIEISAALTDDGDLALAVRDYGPGIPDYLMKNVTDPFAQGDPATGKAREGVGLGLYLVKSFVELHGGRLELVSPPDEDGGTLGRLLFPVDRVRLAESAPAQRSSGGVG